MHERNHADECTSRTGRWCPALVVAVAAVFCPRPANALIVYQGKIVPAWPDIVGPALAASPSPGRQYAPGRAFFMRPAGTVTGLTLLVDFSDQSAAFTRDEIDDWLNLEGYSRFGCNGSVHDFYFDVSNGIVDLQNTVVGFYRAQNPKSYYEAGGNYERAGELVQEVLAAADVDVDFSEYDNDHDGTTEAISIVYAGPSVTWGQGLWPHSGWIGAARDGVRLDRYQMTNMGDSLGLYVFAHETGHMLFGWPDLYGFGDYCVMGNFSSDTNPVAVNDFFRADQGWIPLTDITSATSETFAALANGMGYRYVNPAQPQELFFWSNVQNTDRWSYLRGSGLLVLHYDGTIDGNDPPNPLELAVVQADGEKTLDATMWPSPGSDANDYFRAGYNAELSSSTTPNSDWNDGSPSGLRIYAISATDAAMQFSVGDGSAGGTPNTGGAPGAGGDAGDGGVSNTGGIASVGGGTTGGSDATGGATEGGFGAGGSPASGGAVTAGATSTGGGATAGATSTGGDATAGATTTGGAFPDGGLGSGGLATGGTSIATGGNVSSGGIANLGGTIGAGGVVVTGAGGAIGVTGGFTTESGGSAAQPPGAIAGDEDSGCSCRTGRRSGLATHRGLLALGALAGWFGWARRRRRHPGPDPGARERVPIARA